jgi:hypothetical protein
MGYGLPAAVAASLTSPGRPVVALVGDGGLGMSVADLETAVREGARPIVLVFDNERYGTIWDHQDRRGLAPVATELGPVDWSAIAEAFGAAGARVERDEELEPALRAALASRRPTLLHLAVDRRWVSVDRIDDAPAAAVVVERLPAATEPEAPAAEPAPSPEPGLEPEGGDASGAPEPAPSPEPEPEGEASTAEAEQPAPELEPASDAEAAARGPEPASDAEASGPEPASDAEASASLLEPEPEGGTATATLPAVEAEPQA